MKNSFGHILTVLDQPTVHLLHFTLSVIEIALITLINLLMLPLETKNILGWKTRVNPDFRIENFPL